MFFSSVHPEAFGEKPGAELQENLSQSMLRKCDIRNATFMGMARRRSIPISEVSTTLASLNKDEVPLLSKMMGVCNSCKLE